MWSKTPVACLLVFLIPFAISKDCNTLDGFWYNEVASQIYLKHSSDGKLVGEFKTAVQRSTGATGSLIFGAALYPNKGLAFGFSVLREKGRSAVWTAQCMVCADGKEQIVTSWLHRFQVCSCLDKWESTMIGRHVFVRAPNKQGKVPTSLPTITTNFNTLNATNSTPCDLSGIWYNGLGSEMILKQDSRGIIVGEYRTGVERKRGSAGTSYSLVYGMGSRSNKKSTFAFFVIWSKGASVAGFVGQCNICGVDKREQIESAWVLRKRVSKCGDDWKSTMSGENTFTRAEQRPGPRKRLDTHTPKRDAVNDIGVDQ